MRVSIFVWSLFFLLAGCSPNGDEKNISQQSDRKNPPTNEQPVFSESELLGSKIFADTRLSNPEGLACMSCHNPKAAFTDNRHELPVSRGAVSTHFGDRNAPSAMYLKFIPALTLEVDDEGEELFIGGLFLDGRAQSLKDQAMGPFLNPLEMGATKLYVVRKVCSSNEYGTLFRKVFGSEACQDNTWSDAQVEKSFEYVAEALASFESTDTFSPFSSKFDRVMAQKDSFTEEELMGFNVFKEETLGNCAACHVLETNNSANKALFTDFTYDNLGLPKNPDLIKFGHSKTDVGLSGTTGRDADKGLFRVPSLRNIAKTAPYGHNGYFKTLEQIVDFYNTRDVKPACPTDLSVDEAVAENCWPQPEVSETVNHDELGDLKLSEQDIRNLIAFLKTLSDGH